MKKRDLNILIISVLILSVLGVALNRSWIFLLYACVGLGGMIGISYVDYRKIVSRPVRTWIATFIGLLILGKCGLGGGFGVIAITIVVIILSCSILEKRCGRSQRLRMIIAGVFIGINLATVKTMIYRSLHSIEAFFSGTGEGYYIYEVIGKMVKNSQCFGRSVEASEIISWLPRYNSSCMLTTYIASYGLAVGGAVVIVVATFLGKILFDMRKISLPGKMIVQGCLAILILEFGVAVCENLLLIPFTVFNAFIPFFSERAGDLVISYLVAGSIMSVYRFENGRAVI